MWPKHTKIHFTFGFEWEGDTYEMSCNGWIGDPNNREWEDRHVLETVACHKILEDGSLERVESLVFDDYAYEYFMTNYVNLL